MEIQPFRNPWLPLAGRCPAGKTRLFCFTHAGGGTSLFAGWASSPPEGIEVLPIQLPGRENRFRERPLTSLGPLVEAIADGIRNELHRPFAFFGHSMGALVGFELARFLQERGVPASYLFASACRAPQLLPGDQPLHGLPDSQLIDAVHARFGGVPRQVADSATWMKMLVPVLRADLAVVETYRYQERSPLACPVMTLGGIEDSQVTPADLAAWEKQTTGTFSMRLFPGDHFFLKPSGRQVLRTIARQLLSLGTDSHERR